MSGHTQLGGRVEDIWAVDTVGAVEERSGLGAEDIVGSRDRDRTQDFVLSRGIRNGRSWPSGTIRLAALLGGHKLSSLWAQFAQQSLHVEDLAFGAAVEALEAVEEGSLDGAVGDSLVIAGSLDVLVDQVID